MKSIWDKYKTNSKIIDISPSIIDLHLMITLNVNSYINIDVKL